MIVPNSSDFESLSIRSFGWATITIERAPSSDAPEAERAVVKLETRTAEALLLYLACQARPLGRDVVAELLWPERTQQQARANLRVAIHRLRQQLSPYLLVTRQSIGPNPDARIDLDVALFESYLAGGQLEKATELYQGDFLDGFYLDNSPAFEQWALLERERLRTLALAAWQQLIEQQRDDGQLDAAISSAQRLLQLDPLHEPTHRRLMRLLAQTGQRSTALAQYETCRRLLTTELGVTPDETTTTLAEQIWQGEMDKVIVSPSHPVTVSPPHPHNLPPQSTPFVGRHAELAQIAQRLANPDCRLVTLLGVGGIGKTRLATEIAIREAANYADGAYFVPLTSVSAAHLAPAAIAQSLGIVNVGGDLTEQVAAYLQPRQLLLILDNFEHLLDAGETIAKLLHGAPNLKVLITSTQRLALLEEWLLPISGLSIVEGLADEAGQLFVRCAQRVLPGFTAQGQEAEIAAICRQVEGMPLALELAASWVRVMPCATIADQLRANLDLLTTRLRNLPERHRSLRALLDQTWRLLSVEEEAVLRRLSVFRGGWLIDEATLVAEATLPVLLNLVDKSLLRADEQGRFDMHGLVRQYAAEQLNESDEGDRIRQRHFTAYLQFARRADSRLRGKSAAIWYANAEAEQDNLRAALQWALLTRLFADAAWLCIALTHFWSVRARWHEALRWLEQLLTHRHTLPDDLRLAAMLSLYHLWRSQEAFGSIERYLDELLRLEAACASQLLRAIVWRSIAVTKADFAEAVAAWDRCLSLLSTAGEESALDEIYCVYADLVFQQGFARFRYAIRLTDVGEYAQAEHLSAESLTFFRRRNNRDNILYPLGNLGRLALVRGDVVQARLLLQEAVTIAVEVGNQMGLGDWQPRLGIATLYCGDAVEAERLLIESLELARDLRNDMYLSRVYTYLAETALWRADQTRAAQWLAHAWIHHANPRWPRTELVDCLWVAARLATAQQEYQRAATLFGLAEQIGGLIHYTPIEPIRPLIESALAMVRKSLPPDAFAKAFVAGQQLPLDEAFATILAPDHWRTTMTGRLIETKSIDHDRG